MPELFSPAKRWLSFYVQILLRGRYMRSQSANDDVELRSRLSLARARSTRTGSFEFEMRFQSIWVRRSLTFQSGDRDLEKQFTPIDVFGAIGPAADVFECEHHHLRISSNLSRATELIPVARANPQFGKVIDNWFETWSMKLRGRVWISLGHRLRYLGLSIAQLLQGIGQVINGRDRVRIYWPTMAWAVLLLLVDIQAWWAMFSLRNRHTWTFVQFTIVLVEAIMLYLLAAIVLPNIPNEGEVDLRSNYFRHAGWFFGSLVVVLLDSLLKSVVVSGGLPGKPDLGFHLFWIGTALIAAFTRNERYHKTFVCLSFVLFVAYIALLFSSLR